MRRTCGPSTRSSITSSEAAPAADLDRFVAAQSAVYGDALAELQRGRKTAHRAIAAGTIFGDVDAMKFRSSMTLFEAVGSNTGTFTEALDQFFGGDRDRLNLERLRRTGGAP